ncbi:peroxisomal membrane protein 2 isoform X2 [Chionomys nivalis]|uniref:peroxisomal membrane protein 2 isoform X2 n=1 Tax=Chionomys nivalis TaxID=269649 RepID=UPI002597E295|nr:peroxisomal membrane protein 2 isoform X2 [Chionomys nivalis]
MAPAASRLRAESEFGSLPRRALAQYLLLLKLYPVFTKAVSSGILSALGNLLAQMIEKKQKKDSQSLDVRGLLRYLVYGRLRKEDCHNFKVILDCKGKDASAFAAKMRSGFWPALQMNWRMWTPLQFININYVPLQFRVLFANIAALFWYAYLASLGK